MTPATPKKLARPVHSPPPVFHEFSSTTETPSSTTCSTGKKVLPMRFLGEKPDTRRVIARSLSCIKCHSPVEVTFPTVCITSTIKIKCTGKCGQVTKGSPKKAHIPDDATKQVRRVDFAANNLFVLSFIASGDGGTEAQRLLGILDIQGFAFIKSNAFHQIEQNMSPAFERIMHHVLQLNLVNEVCKTFEATESSTDADFNRWQRAYDQSQDLPDQYKPKIRASFDMGWQKHGRAHDSKSGHCFIVGEHTHLPICARVMNKYCTFCVKHQKDENGIPAHNCTMNYSGSSGGMEPQALLEMTREVYDAWNCILSYICTDDDSTMRKMLRWSNKDYKAHHHLTTVPKVPNADGTKLNPRTGGNLPYPIPQPIFLADPAH